MNYINTFNLTLSNVHYIWPLASYTLKPANFFVGGSKERKKNKEKILGFKNGFTRNVSFCFRVCSV